MDVSLTPELERKVAEKVETGAYASASDLVREALQLLFAAEELRPLRLERLSREIQAGIDQADRGELINGEDSRRRLLERLASSRP